jgi:hypothetical protein
VFIFEHLSAPSTARGGGGLPANGVTYTTWPPSGQTVTGADLTTYSPNSSPGSYDGSLSSHTYS